MNPRTNISESALPVPMQPHVSVSFLSGMAPVLHATPVQKQEMLHHTHPAKTVTGARQKTIWKQGYMNWGLNE